MQVQIYEYENVRPYTLRWIKIKSTYEILKKPGLAEDDAQNHRSFRTYL